MIYWLIGFIGKQDIWRTTGPDHPLLQLHVGIYGYAFLTNLANPISINEPGYVESTQHDFKAIE